jgi:uncharacterized membrane protein YbaN (DUF454 family)
VRWLWLVGGLTALALGGIGIVVPGLPTTVFLIVAAACFTRSSPRLEAWLLGLPRFGPMIRDHRDGLGMPRRPKAVAVAMLVAAVGASAWLLDGWALRSVVLAVGAVGVAWILWRVPTREVVEQLRRRDGG